MAIELIATDAERFPEWEGQWRQLETEAETSSVYTSYDWLRAWMTVCEPRRLTVLRGTRRRGGGLAGLGLLELDRMRGWRFAGGQLTPRRTALCARDCESEMWTALALWLREHPHAWSTLEGSEVPLAASEVPNSHLSAFIAPSLVVPASFEEYLRSLSSRQRHEVRRRLARTEEAGVEVREVGESASDGALADFARFYDLRSATVARSQLDDRLVPLVKSFHQNGGHGLRVFEVCHGNRRLGVSLDFVHDDRYYPYSLAWAPEASHLAPGILLTINVVRYAIVHGLHMIDLGPGGQSYKMSLGFVPGSRLSLRAVNGSRSATLMLAAGSIYARLRNGGRRSGTGSGRAQTRSAAN